MKLLCTIGLTIGSLMMIRNLVGNEGATAAILIITTCNAWSAWMHEERLER